MSGMRIGQFEFINISRPLSSVNQQTVLEGRPGVNGWSIWKTGKRGKPFYVRTVVNLADTDTAQATLQAYEALIGENPVVVTWGGMVRSDVLAFVKSVDIADDDLHATLLGIGGVAPQGTITKAMLYAQWELVSIQTQQ